ncbi:MAG: LytTR family DNA-binding domain-containing protein [Candidatus Izemoplasmatales bacterium]|jgi:DNA-binding LytR/AlgR family response regulator|nr:LytTR family DNA-binding domain-containing protein [Candidatus Izemoplasmatales bacterium]
MRYRIAIVEDEKQNAITLENHIKKYAKEHDENIDIFLFDDGDEITSDYEAKYDIIFLDIEMKRLDGISAAKKIRLFDKEVIIIFITIMPQYAIKGYEVEALSYLLKPVPYFALQQELMKSLERIDNRKKKYVLLKTENGIVRTNVSDIYYVETMKHYLIIHTKIGVYQMKSSLKNFYAELSGNPFCLCNSCYLINLDEVNGVDGENVIINGERLKISRPRKKRFMEELAAHFGGNP